MRSAERKGIELIDVLAGLSFDPETGLRFVVVDSRTLSERSHGALRINR
jgi:hypothetical protein